MLGTLMVGVPELPLLSAMPVQQEKEATAASWCTMLEWEALRVVGVLEEGMLPVEVNLLIGVDSSTENWGSWLAF